MGGETKNLPAYRLNKDSVLSDLESSKEGISSVEALNRLEKYGANELKRINQESVIVKYFRQFKDLMILLLLISSVISFGLDDSRTGIVLLALVIFNTTLGFFQEFRAEKTMQSLEKLIVSKAKVIRQNKLEEIDAKTLVVGDIVYIEEGDIVPADLRLITESELSTNDFALTGESQPSRKFIHAISDNVPLGNRHNIIFMSTTVATGHGYGVVIAIGMQTELGRIANLSQETQRDLSPLQKEMNHTATRVIQGTVILCSILLVVAIKADLSIKDAFLFAIGIASSLIPQGLPAEINTALAQAANKLYKAKALVKKLSAVETLGATSIICTDKTGTLTKNEMTVESILIGKSEYVISGTGYKPSGEVIKNKTKLSKDAINGLELVFCTGALSSNAKVLPPDDKHPVWYCIGDPTEGALITLANKVGFDITKLNEDSPEIKEFSFDSARKRMSSIRKWKNSNSYYVFVKGAPESVANLCGDIWDHGHTRKISNNDKKIIENYNETQAKNALRNLGLAYKVLDKNTNIKNLEMEDIEKDLTWLGIVSMVDPLRDEVIEAIKSAHSAHINVSIVTGDYSLTAKAIAVKAGLAEKPENISLVSGEELQRLDDSSLIRMVEKGGVIFSRVSPEDKLRIVKLVKNAGKIIAVTGDGINDAPALKTADIGVAMGRTGTDVAKQSSDIVLLDDSFFTLVNAIQYGRVIFQNIKKGTLSCFTSNAAELIVNLMSLAAVVLFRIPLSLTVMEILAIDLIAELFPIAALGWDPADREVMTQEPRNPKNHIINRSSILDLLWCGVLIGGFAFVNYILFFQRHGINPRGLSSLNELHFQATALTYLTIVICQLVNILQRRSPEGLFTKYQFHNKQLWFAMCLSMFCVFNILYNPHVAPYFGAGPLKLIDWIYAIGAAVIFIAIREFQRYIKQHPKRIVTNLA